MAERPQAASSSVELYVIAALAGSASAQNNVGVAYLTGFRVKRDTGLGFTWLSKAVDAGNSDARYNLRAACHTISNPPSLCLQHGISAAAYFQHPGAKVLWRSDLIP